MSQQQTLLRVKTNIPSATISGATEFQYLDLYDDIPIKINKSFAELQDISKKNSDFSIGLSLPSSKANNRFFESYFNVEAQSLYFNSQKRVECSVLVDSQSYFSGYMRLNKINVINSSAEYDVTLYSEIGNLFGEIGNKLLKDLDFNDPEYTFNHTFSLSGVTALLQRSNFYRNQEKPYPYFYPIIHNGYNYDSTGPVTLPNVSGTTTGATLIDQTRLYTSTGPISGFTDYPTAIAAGVEEYYINSPLYPLRDNQLKPALSIWNLLKLIFKEYGYTISGDFFNTPWAKSLYLYGYFSSELTKFSYKLNTIQQLPKEGVELIYSGSTLPNSPLNIIVCKRGTGIPCYCLDNINYGFATMPAYSLFGVVNAGTSGKTINVVDGFDFGFEVDGVPVADISTLRYAPKAVGTSVAFVDGDEIDFSLVIDPAVKQIDLIGSIAKKFNLVFIPNPDNVHDIIVEPYDFYVGTGTIKDWTAKLSYDKGFSVEPALNFVESTLVLSDLEDGDEANRIFKNINNRIYGRNRVDNPTDFKSEEKKIETIFSPEIIRKWDSNIGLPLGINYSASSEISTYDNQIRWFYKGVKTKPKLFFWLMGQNPFIDNVGDVFPLRPINTYKIGVQSSLLTGASYTNRYDLIPTISHTMPIGLSDENKINNDSLCILFNSEEPTDTIGVQSYNVYTENDAYSVFYKNRITNIYDQNTRFVRGFFNLNYSDIQNLNPNDIIKINEQHFVLNKVEGFNLTNKELTSVELIQFNVNPQTYPDRYFKYSYCDTPDICFKFKTDFTNPNLLDTNYIWSIYYDNQVGSLTTSTGFTSSFRVFDLDVFNVLYYPYTMQEISKDDYDNGGCYDWTYDTLRNYIYTTPGVPIGEGLLYSLATFWDAGGSVSGFTGVNVWENCTDFFNTASTYGILTGTTVPPQLPMSIGGGFSVPVVSVGVTFDAEVLSTGKILIGHRYTKYSGATVATLTRLLNNGTLDTTFITSGITSNLMTFDMLEQPDGKILVAGLNGGWNLRRLNSNGSTDTGFTATTIPSGGGGSNEERIELQSDGKIIYGNANDNTYSGYTGLMRFNSNGTLDTTFNSGGSQFSGSYSARVTDIYVYPNDKILIAGFFNLYNGVTCNSLIRLNSDGTVDNTFNVDTTTGYTYPIGMSDIEVQADGKILCGSGGIDYGTKYWNNTVGLMWRLNADGTFDSTFPYNQFSTVSSGFNDAIDDIYQMTDGSILVGGRFTSYSGVSTTSLIKLNSNGTRNATFNPPNINTGPFFNAVTDIEITADGGIICTGLMSSLGAQTAVGIIKVNSNTGASLIT